MAHFAHISLQLMWNATTGEPYAGARAHFYQASTTTRIPVYSDSGLGTQLSNPVVADANGRFPAIFIDDAENESYRLRITSSSGSVLPLGDGGSFDIPVIPTVAASGDGEGGSETPVDTSQIFQAGDVLWVPKTGTRTGWFRLNGRSIGDASSGATEFAHASAEDAYAFLWDNYADAICPVATGRGLTAALDFAAHKAITVLDMRGRGTFGLDDMGNSAASMFSGITFGSGNATTAGAHAGAATHILTEAQLAAHDHGVGDLTITNGTLVVRKTGAYELVNTGAQKNGLDEDTITISTLSIAGDTADAGGGQAHPTISPFRLGTFYMKL